VPIIDADMPATSPDLPFPCAAPEDVAAAAEEGGQLWEADWDDEVTGEDFQDKLKRELDRDMKD
jgi:DSS1/SEM1 family